MSDRREKSDPCEKSDPLEEALRDASRPSARIIEKLTRGTSRVVREMLLDIAENFTTPDYTIGKLREKLGVNFRHIRRFRAATGISPSRLLRECRMETGMRLLRDTLLTIEEIAILIGYDARSLERLCKRWCGLNPADFRTQLRRFKGELAELPDDVLSWFFWQQYHFGALSDDDLHPVIEYLERQLCQPAPGAGREISSQANCVSC